MIADFIETWLLLRQGKRLSLQYKMALLTRVLGMFTEEEKDLVFDSLLEMTCRTKRP